MATAREPVAHSAARARVTPGGGDSRAEATAATYERLREEFTYDEETWVSVGFVRDLPPQEPLRRGIWSLLRRGWLSNVAFSTPEHLVQRIRRGLRHIQYRSELIDGCLAETGLAIRPT
ncbi:hypothetical protein Plo01_55150 [Planobispora longispora]|uniref:Transposase n=1 Tax=Planobispora longispora TaxID=28887 RepID=A0A8J3RRW6_9ACTN|nr:hypothetical protein GCM10020093_069300 [Planobispora longispora]GIH79086.1 hypothetical protein Plo01_55150 [Planobispora longispora]